MSILASERESETVLTALPDIQTSGRIMARPSHGKVAEREMRKQKRQINQTQNNGLGNHTLALIGTLLTQKTLSAFKKCLITH